MRIQLAPFPRMNPFHPSSLHIFVRPCPIGSLYSVLPVLCTWNRILRRSSGDTTVLETAPATPPARKAARTGCAIICRNCNTPESAGRWGSCPFSKPVSPSTLATGEGSFLSTLIAKEFRERSNCQPDAKRERCLLWDGSMNSEAVTIYSADLWNFSPMRHTGVADAANRETTLARRDR